MNISTVNHWQEHYGFYDKKLVSLYLTVVAFPFRLRFNCSFHFHCSKRKRLSIREANNLSIRFILAAYRRFVFLSLCTYWTTTCPFSVPLLYNKTKIINKIKVFALQSGKTRGAVILRKKVCDKFDTIKCFLVFKLSENFFRVSFL